MKGTNATLLLKVIKKPFMSQFQVPEHVFALLEQLADVDGDDLDNVETIIEALMPMFSFLLTKALRNSKQTVPVSL